MYLHFHSILTTGHSLSGTLDNSIHNLQCIQAIAKRGPQAAWMNCFHSNVNDLKEMMRFGITEGVKDVR
jgi:hypothetical protein